MFMLGYAWQFGGVPLSRAALMRAIELNGEAVAMNLQAFELGRRAAHDPAALIVGPVGGEGADAGAPPLGDAGGDHRAPGRLSDRLPERGLCARATATSSPACRPGKRGAVPGQSALAESVARHLFKLMAYKDEYEVARLYADGSFRKQVEATFETTAPRASRCATSSTSRRRCWPGAIRRRACRAR